jgi:hypothetical protein
MARKQVLTVRPRPDLQLNCLYRVRVQQTHINKRTATLDVTVEHIEKGQAGRLQSFCFELPLYPDSPASRFLVACGMEAGQVGNNVCADDAGGKLVGMRVTTVDLGETGVTFERVPQITKDGNRDAGAQ